MKRSDELVKQFEKEGRKCRWSRPDQIANAESAGYEVVMDAGSTVTMGSDKTSQLTLMVEKVVVKGAGIKEPVTSSNKGK